VGLSTTAIFSVFAGYFSETLEMKPTLLYKDTLLEYQMSQQAQLVFHSLLDWQPMELTISWR